MPRFTSGGRIHTGEESAEVRKALGTTDRGTPTQPAGGTERQEIRSTAGLSSHAGPSIIPATGSSWERDRAVAAGRPAGQAAEHAASQDLGYAMLARAGWRGGGLGAEEQGITSPLPAWHNQGRRGIGAAPSKQQQQAGPAGKAAMDTQQQGNMAAGGQLGMGDIEGGGKQGRKQQKQTQPAAKPPKRAWASVTVEEPIDTKVKRVKQVLQAEADCAAEKALSRYLYRAFSDAGGYSSTDSNPLLRRNKLSRSNPLL